MSVERHVCHTCGTPDTLPAVFCSACGVVSGATVRDAASGIHMVCDRCDQRIPDIDAVVSNKCLACGGVTFGWRNSEGAWAKSEIHDIPGRSGRWLRASFDGTCVGYDPAATGALTQRSRYFDIRITDGVLTEPAHVDGPPADTHFGEHLPIRQLEVPAIMMVPESSDGVADTGLQLVLLNFEYISLFLIDFRDSFV